MDNLRIRQSPEIKFTSCRGKLTLHFPHHSMRLIQPGPQEAPGGSWNPLPSYVSRRQVGILPGSHIWERTVFSTGHSPPKFQVALTAKTWAAVLRLPLCSADSPGLRAHFTNCSRSPGVASSALLAITQIRREQSVDGKRNQPSRGGRRSPITHPALLPGAARETSSCISACRMENPFSLLGNHQPILLNDHERSQMLASCS